MTIAKIGVQNKFCALEHLSIQKLGEQINNQELDPRHLVEYFLDKIDRDSEKDLIFIEIYREEALQAAQAAYQRAKEHRRLSWYDGIPLVWKDNFNIQGKPTTAGLKVFQDKIATENAVIYQIAVESGLICLGKTNMTELAFSGLGINPNFGTPSNPFDLDKKRVPGGSSSGSAIAVAKGLCCVAIGTDTGGSIRTPAAWNNLVGLKTTAGLLPTEGIIPLSQTLDTVGFLTRTIEDAASLYNLFTRTENTNLSHLKLADINLLVCQTTVWEQINQEVLEKLTTFIENIATKGIKIHSDAIVEFEQVCELINRQGNIVSYEASQNWLKFLEANPECISPDIFERFSLGATLNKSDIEQVHQGLYILQQQYLQRTHDYQVVLMPTVVSLPPVINELEQDSQKYQAENLLSLRNTRLVNLLGLCALSLPIGMTDSGLPIGLMLVAPPFSENLLLTVGAILENLVYS
ncbi:amidase [Nostoc sp. UHCC 0252]|uniref:amidase n=1 Tax=Nostoc sp. UHCC 0252 TaxID=3110241 RepID=UPI002B1F0A0B|nr:amidase family protein [Nostoc sp. UHCC 0252]MEA5605298.1 amidase family protein [Nostoc sp. UHCC 0252]